MRKVTRMSEAASTMEKDRADEGDRECVWEGCSFGAMWASGEAFQAEGAARADLEVGICLLYSRNSKEVSVVEESDKEGTSDHAEPRDPCLIHV